MHGCKVDVNAKIHIVNDNMHHSVSMYVVNYDLRSDRLYWCDGWVCWDRAERLVIAGTCHKVQIVANKVHIVSARLQFAPCQRQFAPGRGFVPCR